MAGLTWLIVLPASLVLRHRPEDYGYVIDGMLKQAPLNEQKNALHTSPNEEDATLSFALKTRSFWFLTSITTILFMVLNAISLHVIPYAASLHLSENAASLIAMFVVLTSVPGRLLFGWLSDILNKRFALIITVSFVTIGLVLFSFAQMSWHFVIFVIFFGLGFGGVMPLRAAIVREYYGRKHFGAIHGILLCILTVGGIFGPAFAGWIYDSFGTYQIAWLSFTLATAATLPLAYLMASPLRSSNTT